MQTLQCFTNSLHDHASLQRLRDNLHELPKRLLSRNEQPEDYLLGTVSGECNYHFKFRLEGGGFFQTGVLVASAEKTPGGLPVALKCRWKRRVGDLPVEIPGVTSNMYQISADDVGTEICVEAQPADVDDGLHGVVVGEIGPFELDPATRRSLDDALGAGGSRFAAAQPRSPGDPLSATNRQDLVIHVSAEGVRVVAVQGGAERSGREVSAEYSADYPKVIIHPLDTTKFQLIMNESKTFHLIAMSRTSRDLIALTIRCFHSKKYLSTERILETLLPVRPLVPGSNAPMADSRLDACILLERLTKELNRAMQQKEVSEKVLRNTKNEKKQLQAQLMETITACTDVIEGLEQNADGFLSASAPVPVERLREQLREASAQSQAAQAELQARRRRLAELQAARRAAEAGAAPSSGPSLGDQVRQLGEERNLLQARLAEVSLSSGTLQQRDQADQVHTQELKRLRQDVEALHSQKEQLRQQLQDQDREREELQQSFLYVKRQLDKVQMRQAGASSSSGGDGDRELQRQREVLGSVEEERSRLAMRLEGVLREAEKEKAYHEQSLERVMTANARLMEERDRTAAEVQRLSRLYAESVNQLRGEAEPLSVTGTFRPEALAPGGAEEGPDPEEVVGLRSQIAQADEALKRREQENESLKNRIRKLAVA